MIRRVKVQGYKSLRNIDIDLSALTLILGANAAGKSNLLDALALLSRMATSDTLREAFAQHRGMPLEAFYYGEGGIKALLVQKAAQFTIEVDVDLGDDVVRDVEERIQKMREGLPDEEGNGGLRRRRIIERHLRYTLTVELQTHSGYLRVLDERLVALNNDGSVRQSRNAFVEKVGEDRLHLRMERQSHPTVHEIGLPYTLISRPLYPPHYPHITAFKEELSRWRFYYLEPKSMREESALKEVRTLGPFGSDLAAFYNTLRANNQAQYRALQQALKTLIPNLDGFDVERTGEGFLQLQILEDQVPFSARVISEGTLRILGLLAITNPLSPTTLIGYEEPENGVHPRRLQLIAELLKNAASSGKQLLINTHSPSLPNYFEEASVLLCHKQNRATVFTPLDLPLFLKSKVEDAIGAEKETSFTERLLRGDYGG
ncbi:MAG TPA: AAA family ATPase [Anaerolineae bacterium]|nr:AAA family ATPase [Anaerolineae bacterium]HQK12380.1 AAA family ATPase [Anaerolineae bacterium]